MINFGQNVCGDLNVGLQKEWLETNALGGFASSTITGCNTRRYHGLLVAALNSPVERFVLLSKLEETLIIDNGRYDLSVNQYLGSVHPHGQEFLKAFRLDPFPIFTYEVEGVTLEKSVFMIHGENSTVVQYSLLAETPRDVWLEARPLIAFRGYHALTHENGALNRQVELAPGRATVRPYDGLPALHLAHDADEVATDGDWYRNFAYEAERERGLDFSESLFSPCAFNFDLRAQKSASIIASLEPRNAARAMEYRATEIARRGNLVAAVATQNEFLSALTCAADQFIVARGTGRTVIAGYHWFGDWGRDTMIALPGLTLATGRADAAKEILLGFARYVDQGMLPNRFPDAGEPPEYNTVDATLWYFEAVRALLEKTGDDLFIRDQLYATLTEIIDWHGRGTRYGIRVDEDGLLRTGEPGVQLTQLTWMDARVGDRVITPRTGKPVEIEALWYNALRVMETLAEKFGDQQRTARYAGMAERAHESFNRLFWNEAAGCLYDVIEGEARDATIRPNQIFAVSLPHSMLAPDRAKRVVATVERDLLTPYGLRSLAPGDPLYVGHYVGGPAERDAVYHQGTVWAWLLGPFIAAYLRAHGNTAQMRARAAEWLAPLTEHLTDVGLGQISEIFDGDAPHTPRGAVAQAWSVATLLEAAQAVFQFAASPPNETKAPAKAAQIAGTAN